MLFVTGPSKTIWHVSSNRWNSAITEYALSAARACQLAGLKSCFTPLLDSPAERRARGYGLAVHPMEKFSIGSLSQFRSIKDKVNPQVMIVYGGPETFLSKFIGVPTIRFRGQALDQSGWLANVQQQFSLAHVHFLVTPSKALANIYEKLIDIPVHSIPLGVDAKKFKPKSAGRSRGRPVVTILGRFDPVKGHAMAFRIFREVAARFAKLNPLLQVVGLPANLSEIHLRQAAIDAGLREDQVRFVVEKVEDLATLMSDTTVGWIPSIGSEVICRVAEEFLLCGTPIVSTNVGSLPECAYGIFGETYSSESQGVEILGHWLSTTHNESNETKEKRAARAREQFSLETMSKVMRHALSGLVV